MVPSSPAATPWTTGSTANGLASLSIFIEEGLDPGDRLEGFSSVGAVNAFSRIIDEYQLSVVGEVPGITVEKVAASIVKQ